MSEATETKPSFVQELREETMKLHKEAGLFDARKPGEEPKPITKDEYIQMLKNRWVGHSALERLVDAKLPENPQLARLWHERMRHTANIRADLKFFEVDADKVEPSEKMSEVIEQMDTVANANSMGLIGHLYTFEGSMNGNSMLAVKYRGELGLPENGDGTRYLNPYGDAQKGYWAEFKATMEDLDINDDDKASITNGAIDIFRAMLKGSV